MKKLQLLLWLMVSSPSQFGNSGGPLVNLVSLRRPIALAPVLALLEEPMHGGTLFLGGMTGCCTRWLLSCCPLG